MPSVGRFPCQSCSYIANNRRMLARHVVVVHSNKVYKCPLCPFITRYAANWYRHKRDIHGLTRLTTCEICGFFANSTEELARHKESQHPETLQLQKYREKYTKEKQRLEASPNVSSFENITLNPEPSSISNEGEESNYDVNFITNTSPDDTLSNNFSVDDQSILFSLPVNGDIVEDNSSLYPSINISQPDNTEVDSPESETMSFNNAGNHTNSELSPLKVRRSYSCDSCGLLTGNPREFLYHQRDVHQMKINIHECKYCIYASKHIQKLQRHCGLVHRQLMMQEQKQTRPVRKAKVKNTETRNYASSNSSVSKSQVLSQYGNDYQTTLKKKTATSKLLNCAACNYHTRNKFLLLHHEKTVHLKKKFYRCLHCGYVTNEKNRYAKHMKYHSLPKMKCEFCNFSSAYKSNLERHMKNHYVDATGEFSCTYCNFITRSKHSLKLHVTNHHHKNEDVIDVEFDDVGDEQFGENVMNDAVADPTTDVDNFEWGENFETENAGFASNYKAASSTAVTSSDSGNKDYLWKQGKIIKKRLKCQYCEFRAAWPFEIRKHEENHRSLKKHPCPLCGMRFEHIAWLTKHLYRIHKENSQARNIAAVFELLKPNRRKTAKEKSPVPAYEPVVDNTVFNNERQLVPRQSSLLSTLLKNPNPVPDERKLYNKPKTMNAFSENSELQPLASQVSYSAPAFKTKPNKSIPSCNKCNYKTKWISELEKHMRVHSNEKPFHCSRCNYHSKWKGDLTRHMMKYHNIKLPYSGKKYTVPKLKLKKAIPNTYESENNWQTVNQELVTPAISATPKKPETRLQESPLDLTICRDFPQALINTSGSMTFPNETEIIDLSKDNCDEIYPQESTKNSTDFVIATFPEARASIDIYRPFDDPPVPSSAPSVPSTRKKYHCPFCSLKTSTASRFHCHIVQHYNKKPFMCSYCGYRSNWEWDITKHIRLRGSADKAHGSASVLLTDETGRRNYDKYDKYLKDVEGDEEDDDIDFPNDTQSDNNTIEIDISNDDGNDYNSKNYSSNPIITEPEDAPVNIVVTPDININLEQDTVERQDAYNSASDFVNAEESYQTQDNNFKYYLCKHCNYKHPSRKVVISHLSVHAGLRPFRCRVCGLTSTWRHVVVRHVKVAHNGYMNDVEDRITYTQEGYVIRLTSVKAGDKAVESATTNNSSHYSCKFCPYKCDKEVYIKFHMKQHKPREGAIYQCTFCPYFVKFKKTLLRHMKLHEASNNNEPNITGVYNSGYENNFENRNYEGSTSASAPSYDPYNYNADDEDRQVSRIDGDSISIRYEQLSRRMDFSETLIKRKRHECENCPYKTDNKTQYLYHKQFHRPNNAAPFKCTICSYWATLQHLLTQHMKVHQNNEIDEREGSVSVDNDDDDDTDAGSPRVKRRRKDELEQVSSVYVRRGSQVMKMFKCRYCPMMNKKKSNVRGHQRMHGSTVETKAACSICNYKCLNQGGLTNHMKIHQANDEHQVNATSTKSNKAAVSSEIASSGMRKKVFSYFCMKCPAVFKSPSDLYIHKNFHGSTLPFPCPHCDYRARHKPHLHKHLQVHTPEYIAKRDASYGPQVMQEYAAEPSRSDKTNDASINSKKIDQMLLLEASEVKVFLKRGKEAVKKMQKCCLCPAAFLKNSTLAYHISLHGSEGEFSCTQCNYATTRSANLSVHSQLHRSSSPVKRPQKSFCCPKCPAVFYKNDRFERHFNLHGKNYRYACDQCDYSVRFAANLIKHKQSVHTGVEKAIANVNSDNASTASVTNTATTTTVSGKSQNDTQKQLEVFEEKKTYVCDRCPYFQVRKDAVQSHQRRHWQKEGYKCPYCDYSSLGPSFLRDHVKSHIQPTQLFPPQAFMKFDKFEIWCKQVDDDELIFEDKGDEYECSVRFHPSDKSDNTTKNAPLKYKFSISKHSKSKKHKKHTNSLTKVSDGNLNENSEDSSSEQEVQPKYLPKVMLTDIFCEKKTKSLPQDDSMNPKSDMDNSDTEKFSADDDSSIDHDKCNFQNKITSEKEHSSSTTNKSSLIVKIKVDNQVNSEKSTYIIENVSDKVIEDSKVSKTPSPPPVSIKETSVEKSNEQILNHCDPDQNSFKDSDIPVEHDSVNDINENHVVPIEISEIGDQCKENIPVIENKYCFMSPNNDSVSVPPANNTSIPNDCEEEFSTDFLKELNSLVNGVTSDCVQNNDFRPEVEVHI